MKIFENPENSGKFWKIPEKFQKLFNMLNSRGNPVQKSRKNFYVQPNAILSTLCVRDPQKSQFVSYFTIFCTGSKYYVVLYRVFQE